MNQPQKRIIVFISNGNGQYVPREYDSFEEAILDEKHTNDWYLCEAQNGISAYGRWTEPKEV